MGYSKEKNAEYCKRYREEHREKNLEYRRQYMREFYRRKRLIQKNEELIGLATIII